MWPFRRKPTPNVRGCRRTKDIWHPSMPLLYWSKTDAWLLRHAYEGTVILGSTGSGKSTASGRTIAHSFLRAPGRIGGLVLTAKPDERKVWERCCKETGRSRDLIVVGPDEPWRFNFLDQVQHTENVLSLFTAVLEMAERNRGSGGGREDEGYWRRSMRQKVRNLIDLLSLSGRRVTIPDLYRLVVSLPTSLELVRSEDWRNSSFAFRCLADADGRSKTPQQKHDLGLVADYVLVEFPGLSEKTRSIIVSTFTSLIDVLNRGILRELFCTETNLTPDVTQDGYIVLVDLPIKEFADVGLIGQTIFKVCWQRSIERRRVVESPRPNFLWIDEAQNFVSPTSDMQFQATARSSRVATVYLVQNISSMVAAMGASPYSKAEVDAVLGNCNQKIFHAQSDPATCEFASALVGRTKQFMCNANNSYQPGDWVSAVCGLGGGPHVSAGVSEIYEYELPPHSFARLRTGGPEHGWMADAVVFQSGRVFRDTGRNWRFATFNQKG